MPSLARFGLPIVLLALVAVSALAAAFDTFPGDEEGIRRFQAWRSSWLDHAAVAATSFSNWAVAAGWLLAFSAVFWIGRRKADAVIVLLVVVPELINQALKALVDRPRPEFSVFSLLESAPGTASFPSGHSVHAILLFGLLMVIVGKPSDTCP